MEIGIVHVEATAAGAPATIPEGHLEYHKDTDKLYKSDGTTKTELAAGGTFTTEDAQDAVGAMVDTTLVYTDATPLLSRAALTGDVTASAGSNSTTIANDAVTFAKMQNISTDRLIGRDTAASGDPEEISVSSGLSFSGSASIISNSRALNVATTPVTINNSAVETSVFTYTIPANTLGASGFLELKLFSEWLNNSGANRGVRIRVKLGGTTVMDIDSGANFSSNASRHVWPVTIYIGAAGATNSQNSWMRMDTSSNSGTFGTLNTGLGKTFTTNGSFLSISSNGASAIDMTSNQTLGVTCQLSTNLTTLEWKTVLGVLTLVAV